MPSPIQGLPIDQTNHLERKAVLWRACNLTSFSPCLTGPVDYPFASHHKVLGFKSPGGYLCETEILLLVMACYIGDPDVIDHLCGLVWGGLCPEPSLGPRADNVIIPLDLTQLFFFVPVSRSLQVWLLASQPTESAAGGEPCGEPAISLHSHHVSLVQWTTCLLPITRDPVQIPRGVLMWNRDSPVSDVSLQSCLLGLTKL